MLNQAMVETQKNRSTTRAKYEPPHTAYEVGFNQLLNRIGRPPAEPKQLNFLKPPKDSERANAVLYYAGQLELLERPCVAIIGSRKASPNGKARAQRLARELAQAGVVVVSGLASGIDVSAHKSAIENGGNTIAVIGTPLNKAYPAAHAQLQQEIYTDHLLITPFATGQRTFASSFPIRNRVMAALCDATVVIEASDTSGTLHQAAECIKWRRWLFIANSVVQNKNLTWPSKFINYDNCVALSDVSQIITRIGEKDVR